MKSTLHPKYYPETKITCSCGSVLVTGSTKPDYSVDICSSCHPFFTGEQRFIDTQGRVEKFQLKQKAASGYSRKTKKAAPQTASDQSPLTLKEMLSAKSR